MHLRYSKANVKLRTVPGEFMRKTRQIYVYPLTNENIKPGSNPYIPQLILNLNRHFQVINNITDKGLIDAIAKFGKTDIYYLNWIEDVPTKRYGVLQTLILPFFLVACKIANKKIVWFIHNNISHSKKKFGLKKFIVGLLLRFADLILSHSAEVKFTIPKDKSRVFHHPLEKFRPLPNLQKKKYDVLIWGSVSPYKGISEFVEHAAASASLSKYKFLIAGSFPSIDYYEEVINKKSDNISVINKMFSEEELIELFSESKYILFTYASESVLSSAALCKSLSFGKEVIAPCRGSFKELGRDQLLHNFDSFASLEKLLDQLSQGEIKKVEEAHLHKYAENTSWERFSGFLEKNLNGLFKGK